MTTEATLDFLEVRRDDATSWRIARRRRPASESGKTRCGHVWLGGFASDMQGSKASFLDARAAVSGRAMLRFDYSGHGESAFDVPGGRFEDGSIGDWLEQSLALFLASTEGPQLVIGSSMGAWIALLLAQRLEALGEAKRLLGLLLIAPAVDFTEELLLPSLNEAEKRELHRRERGDHQAEGPLREPAPDAAFARGGAPASAAGRPAALLCPGSHSAGRSG